MNERKPTNKNEDESDDRAEDGIQADYEIALGDFNNLEVVRFVDFGLYLDTAEGGILLPRAKIPAGTKEGDILRVFIYKDSENRLIATTDTPLVRVDHCEILEVKAVTKFGAFVEWGIENQLLVPFAEQAQHLEEGDRRMVYLYHDHVSDRLVGSTRLDRHINNQRIQVSEMDKVDLYIFEESDIGYKALINRVNIGLIYAKELEDDLEIGSQLKGYVKKIREDKKIDLSLRQPGFGRVLGSQDVILGELEKRKGFIPLNDKSSPEEIKRLLNMSKGDFKKACGMLMKKKIIKIESDGIRLVTPVAKPLANFKARS